MNDYLKEPALYVGDTTKEINLSLPPLSGEEYLRRVILEAKHCDDVAFVKIDESRLKRPILNVRSLPECEKAPAYLCPSLEWQNCQISDFSNVRLYIARIRDELTNCLRKKTQPEIKLPDMKNQEEWVKISTNSENPEYIQPTLTVILSMNQPLIEQVLEYLLDFVEVNKTMEYALGSWLYALLAALELPLNPDMCSCLRSLARVCSLIRSELNPEKFRTADSLNLFICLVARYFRQLDLAD